MAGDLIEQSVYFTDRFHPQPLRLYRAPLIGLTGVCEFLAGYELVSCDSFAILWFDYEAQFRVRAMVGLHSEHAPSRT